MMHNYLLKNPGLSPKFILTSIRWIAILFIILFTSNIQAQTVISVPYNANGTFTVPAGVTQINVEAWGGGGGGGGSLAGGSGGSGGGAGGYLLKNNITVAPATAYPITVGTGGSGFSGLNGGSGLSSGVAALSLTANGGGGGGSTGGAVGSGGLATGGTTNITGGSGLVGAPTIGGKGGNSPNGTILGGIGGNGSTAANGNPGGVPGGGGGGGHNNGGPTNGGPGGDGRVIITYIAPPTVTSFSPNNGCPGTLVTITGTNFTGVNSITFGGTPATSFNVVSATQITVTVPLGAVTGPIKISRPTGFVNSTTFTVNASPVIAAISGPSSTCIPNTITLSHPNTGGTYTSSTPSVATVNASGIVTPVAAGTTVITYVVNVSGCLSTTTKTITVYSVLTVSAPSVICVGSTAQLTPGSGGAWTSSNNAVASVDSSTGIVTGISQGTVNFTFTTSTCSATTSNMSVDAVPVITSQPAPTQSICEENAVSFTVAATGGNLIYQWYKGATALTNGGAISGANSATLTINPVAPSDAGLNYNIVITNGCGIPVTSANAALVVNAKPILAVSSSSQTSCSTFAITPITFTNPNNVPGGVTYSWTRTNTTNITGLPASGTGNTISGTLTNTAVFPNMAQNTVFTIIATSVNGCVSVAQVVTVTVNKITPATISFVGTTICSGVDLANFTSPAATGSGLVTYQWQSGPTATGPWTNIATTQSYSPPALTNTTYYRRQASSTVGASVCSAFSNVLTITVNKVTASQISGSQSVCTENPAAFTVTTAATGSGPLTYQWQSNTTGCTGTWTDIAGATLSTYDPPFITQTTFYQVIVKSTLNTVACTAASNCLEVRYNNKTWSGAAGNNDWNTAGNWVPNGVPSSESCVVIPNTASDPIISGSGFTANAKNVDILNGGRLDVNQSNTLAVENAVNVSTGLPLAELYILDDASLVQTNNVSNVGIAKVQRITQPMYRYDYTYWSNPMKLGTYTLGMLSPLTLSDKYFSWTPTVAGGDGTWFSESASTIMSPLKGYIVRAPQTYSTNPAVTQAYTASFEGTPNNGDITMPISIGTLAPGIKNDKLNLIGNPYPSAVFANAFLGNSANTGVIGGTIYFWTHHTPPSSAYPDPFYGDFAINYSPNGYATYNLLGGTNSVPTGFGGTAPNGYIASGQGFFVKGLANGNVLFNNSMRVAGSNTTFFRPGAGDATDEGDTEMHRIWLNLADTSGSFSQVLIGYTDGATDEIDRDFDGERMDSDGVSLYSINLNENFGIQGRALPFDENKTVPLGFTNPEPNMFTIGIDHLDGIFETQNVYLEDKLLNVIHNLKSSVYSFTSEAGTFNERFVLRYTESALGNIDLSIQAGVVAILKNNKLLIESGTEITTVQIFDISGKSVATFNPRTALKNFENDFHFENGTYLVKVTTSNGFRKAIKLIHKN